MLITDPFFVAGGDTACLLIHGFSGNPADLRPLADALVACGFTVQVPLLPGHGPTPEGAGSARWRDWVRAVAIAHDALARSCSRVIVIGHSMGGMLAVVDAVRRPPDALGLLAVPTFVADWRVRLLPAARYFVPWWYPLRNTDFNDPPARERMLAAAPQVDLNDPAAQRQLRYSVRIPTKAIVQFFRVMRYGRGLLDRIGTPTLIVQGRLDTTALPACATEIYSIIRSVDKELMWFDRSGHMLVTGPEGHHIVQRIVSWVIHHAGPATT